MTTPHNFSNTASGATLGGALSSSATSVLLDLFANFPAAPFTATIDRNLSTEEIVLVSAVVGTTVTIQRGYDGSTAQAHSAGATFEHTAIAKHFRDAEAHSAATAAHSTTSAVVGVADAQTLSNKTVLALLAQATAGAPAVTADAPTGVASKLLSLKQAGVEKAFVDYLGNLSAQAVTGTSGAFSGALSGAATTLASLAVSGTSAFTGAVTVPAATVAAHPTPKSYVDAADTALGNRLTTAEGTLSAATAAVAPSTIVKRDASGNVAIDAVTLTDAPTAVGHAVRKDYVDGRVDPLDARTNNAGTSGVFAGTAPAAGVNLKMKTFRGIIATDGAGVGVLTFPGGAFANGLLGVFPCVASADPIYWTVVSATTTAATLKAYNGAVAVGALSITSTVLAVGW